MTRPRCRETCRPTDSVGDHYPPNACAELIDKYVRCLRLFEARACEGGCIVSTPFLDRHNDAVEVFVEQRDNDQLWLTDDGYTIADLRSSGMEFTTPKRRSMLEATLNGLGVRLDGEQLCVPASRQDFAQKMHLLIQTVLAANDMFVMAEPRVLQLFLEAFRLNADK